MKIADIINAMGVKAVRVLDALGNVLWEAIKALKNYTIYGNSVVDGGVVKGVGDEYRWNQMIDTKDTITSNGITISRLSNGAIRIYGTATDNIVRNSYWSIFQNFNIPTRHKVLFRLAPSSADVQVSFIGLNYSGNFIYDTGKPTIANAVYGVFRTSFIINQGVTIDETYYPYLFDLTAMGIADQVNTIEDFKAYLVKIGKMESVEDDIPYFPHDAGSVRTSLPIVAKGKNLFDKSTNTSYILNSDGTTNYTLAYWTSDFIRVNGQVTISWESAMTEYMRIGLYNQDKVFVNRPLEPLSSHKFTTLHNGFIRLSSHVNVVDVQLEQGSTATSYTPYVTPKTYPVQIPSPLHKVGNVADVLDYKQGGITRRCKVENDVVVPLDNPIFDPLALPKIELFDGIQLTTDTEVQPSKVEIEL